MTATQTTRTACPECGLITRHCRGCSLAPARTLKTCPVCALEVPVVNYAVERIAGRNVEVGYLGRHWRPGIARTAKCRGSFGPWAR